MSSPTGPTTPPVSGVTAGNWFTSLEAYLQNGWSQIVSTVQGFLSGLVPLLDLAQQDLPVLAQDLASFANILTVAFPQAGALTSYVSELETIITAVEGYVKTIAGVIMGASEAKQIGAAVNPTPITGAEKMATVLSAVQSAYPKIPESVHRQAIEVSLGKIKSKVSVTKP